jgi:Mn2+/Fe2+ NRAMP family transporter
LAGVSFLLALMGWMPAPIDVSVWPSLWSLERKKQTGHTPTVKESLIDFHIGYLSTGVLALAFVGLGSLVMCGTGKEFSNSGISFSGQLVELYSSTLGSWSWGLISLVAFLTMFSTTLTVMDGYARTLKGSVELMFPAREKSMNWLYWLLLPVLMILSLLIIGCFMSGFKTLIDVATILAFLTAPVFAVLNFKVVLAKQMPDEQKPGLFMKTMSWIGILVLCGFSLVYIYLRWF